MKEKNNNRYHRDKNNRKRMLQTVICQQIGHSKRNGHISRNMQPSYYESGRNRQSEQTNH